VCEQRFPVLLSWAQAGVSLAKIPDGAKRLFFEELGCFALLFFSQIFRILINRLFLLYKFWFSTPILSQAIIVNPLPEGLFVTAHPAARDPI
jgi:hypothetical protein